jgi:hypothetical protein
MKGSSGGGGYASYGGSGGGAIHLNAAGTLTVNGTISANGATGGTYSGSYGAGGGAGGSIWLTANEMVGNGIIRANGGAGGNVSTGGGGGGGGRITSNITSSDTYAGTKTATGGAAGTGATAGSAGVVTWPAAPATGAQHVVFGTSTYYDGALGGSSGADAKCQARAEAAGLFGGWKALVSTATEDAYNHITLTGRVHNLNNELVATNISDLFDGTISNGVKYNEYYAVISGEVRAWTGSLSSGAISTNNCSEWTSFAIGNGMTGNATLSTSAWINSADATCGNALRLYCVSQ